MPPTHDNRETRRNRKIQTGKQHAVTSESTRIHKRGGPSNTGYSRGEAPDVKTSILRHSPNLSPPPPTRFYLRRGGPHGHELVIESPFRWTDLSANDLKNKPNLGYASYFPGGVYFFEPGKVDKERSRLKAAGQNHTIYDYNYEFPRKRTLKELKKSTWTIRQCVS